MGVVEDMLKEAGMEIKSSASVVAPDAANEPLATEEPTPTPNADEESAKAAAQQQNKPSLDTPTDEAPVPPVVDDSVVLEAINKRLGTSYKSLEELENSTKKALTDEEQEAIAKERKENIVKFALEKGIYKSDDLNSYAIDKDKSPRQIALELFTEKMLKAHPNSTPEEIEDSFKQSIYEDAEDGHPLKALKAVEIEQLKDDYLNKKYSNIHSAEKEFDNFNSMLESGLKYSQDVKGVIGELGGGNTDYELSFNVAGVDLKWKAPAETIKAIESTFLTNETFLRLGAGDIKREQLKESVQNALILQNLPKILTEVAESYHSAKVLEEGAKQRGIPVRGDINSAPQQGSKKELSGPVKEILAGMPTARTA